MTATLRERAIAAHSAFWAGIEAQREAERQMLVRERLTVLQNLLLRYLDVAVGTYAVAWRPGGSTDDGGPRAEIEGLYFSIQSRHHSSLSDLFADAPCPRCGASAEISDPIHALEELGAWLAHREQARDPDAALCDTCAHKEEESS